MQKKGTKKSLFIVPLSIYVCCFQCHFRPLRPYLLSIKTQLPTTTEYYMQKCCKKNGKMILGLILGLLLKKGGQLMFIDKKFPY